MKKLFAAYLAQKISADFVSGEYDPEQELWVANNQLQGVNPFYTINETETQTKQGTVTTKWVITGMILESVQDLDTKVVPDTDSGPDI